MTHPKPTRFFVNFLAKVRPLPVDPFEREFNECQRNFTRSGRWHPTGSRLRKQRQRATRRYNIRYFRDLDAGRLIGHTIAFKLPQRFAGAEPL